MAIKQSKRLNFSPNEAMAYGDLNDMQKVTTQRSWEIPGYSDLLGTVRFQNSFSPSFSAAFNAPTDLQKICFTKGAGITLTPATLTLYLSNGFLGTYNAAVAPQEFGLSSPAPAMRWGWIDDPSGETVTVAAASPAQFVYSLIWVSFAETASDAQARHFKSAASGAKSSAATAKRLSTVGTLGVTNGTSAAIPTMPALPPGKSLIGITKQSSTLITQVYDCTVPFGPLRETVFRGKDMFKSNATEGASGSILSFGAAGLGVAQAYVSADPKERILGFEILHTLNGSTAVITMVRAENNTAVDILGSQPFQLTGGTDFTADGTLRNLQINCLGQPIASGGVLKPPLWGHGRYYKTDTWDGHSNEGLAISLLSNDGVRDIRGIRMYSIIG